MRWSLVSAALLAGRCTVHAFPLLTKRDVSADVLNQLSFFEQYAAAAYCNNNNDPTTDTKVTCSAGNCPSVESADSNTVTEFRDAGNADATGFVAVDKTNNLIVVAYRGSRSLANWIGNINFAQDPYLCDGCSVHRGFLSSWTATRDQVRGAVDSARAANPGFNIVITGHSLGGAIATLAASELRDNGYPVALYTYGSPMVGNSAYAQHVTNQGGGNYRVTHQSDLVPKLPGYEILDYRHISPQYWISSDEATVSTSDVSFSEGIFDELGNWATSGFSILDHLWYFNSVALCTPFPPEWN